MNLMKIIPVFMGVAVLVFACSQVTDQHVKTDGKVIIVKILEPKEAYDMIEKNKNNPSFTVLDVRTPDEYKEGHIEGAVNINYNEPSFNTELARLDKKKTYLVYCRTGRRSKDAVQIMVGQGFENIFRFQGDITRWKSEGLPLIK